MEHGFGIAIGLLTPLEHKITGRLEGNGIFKIDGHWFVQGIAGILAIDHGRHAGHRVQYLLPRANALMQPIGDMLR